MNWARSIVMVAVFAAGVDALADGQRPVSLVPWKVLPPGESVDAPLVLFWVPASASELRRSPLLSSDELTRYSARCVAMRVVRADDAPRLARLGIGDELPAAVLVARDGRVIGSVRGDDVRDVEDLVRDELDLRTFQADALLDDARRRAAKGDVAGAVALYRQVWEARCMCPRQGKVAQKALRRLEKR